MSAVYTFAIEKREIGYCFCLYPNNSKHQPIGISMEYPDVQECVAALRRFQNAISTDLPYPSDKCHARIEITDEGKFLFAFYDGEQKVFYRDRKYDTKENCIKAINNVIAHYNAELRNN